MAKRDAVPAMLFAILCVLATVGPVAAAPDESAAGPGVEPLVQQGVVPDSTRIVVDIDEDGSARWEIQYWTRLDDQNTTDAFDSLRQDIEANPDNYTASFEDRIGGTVSAAENSTGREMTVTNVSVAAETQSLPDSYGVVTYSFRWSNFAQVDGEQLVVGDAIEGFFLDSSSRLIISWPESYGTTSVAPSPDETRDNTVIWRGADTEFVSGEPQLVLQLGAGTPTATTEESTEGNVPDDPFPTTTALAALAIVGTLIVGGGIVYVRSRDSSDGDAPVATGDEPGPADGGAAAATVPPKSEPTAAGEETDEEPVEDANADDDIDDDESDADDANDDGDDEPSPPPELLSNEERVLRLIESRGGRIKQQEVASALDWTDAKTSKVVRGMRDEGTLEGFRLGRENVLQIPDADGEESTE